MGLRRLKFLYHLILRNPRDFRDFEVSQKILNDVKQFLRVMRDFKGFERILNVVKLIDLMII